ncbi:MAG: HAMP domain-containing protein [Hyphomicrobium zavarzinii]|uniref:ATP-binding protein n=1 Tax=Hyphomicrobium zavarzinii TaxID=48292 RepID=UPI001A3DC317|nr:ATP-binding protein [Hyphomicrobium zavarzinii]MBL8844343.1 HAMP domain-containing protein [Hyphomicrobium zavarzinii]
MKPNNLARLGSVRLGTRIALTMLGAMLAIQALNSAIFFLLPRPTPKIYSARWIVAETQKVVGDLTASPQESYQDVAKRFQERTGLTLRQKPEKSEEHKRKEFPALQRVTDTLQAALAGKVSGIEVKSLMKPHGPPPDTAPVTMPPEFEFSFPKGPLTDTEPDIPIWSQFAISFETSDGRHFEISTRPPRPFGQFFNPMVISAASAILLVALLSAWIAKRSLRPLDELVAAARRLGSEREPTPIETAHLREYAAIGEAMNEMQVRIKDFVDERTQILAAVSHDLRTALTRLRLESEQLPEGEAKQRLILGVTEMEGMISATLTFAGDDLKGERSEPLDVAALLITICDNFTDVGAVANYEGPDHAQAICQPTAIRRAFTNLIDNAIKYGKEAEVSLTREADFLVITIADRGPGIAPDQVELAFKPFRRLEQSRNRETGGVGLGLTIARDIVRAHGGSIALATREEGGLAATVRLPSAQQSR